MVLSVSTGLPHYLRSGASWLCCSFLSPSHLCGCGWDKRAESALDHILSSSSRSAYNCSCRVWVGFQENRSMQGLSQARLWTSTMSLLLDSVDWSESQSYSDSREGESHFLVGEDEKSLCAGRRYRQTTCALDSSAICYYLQDHCGLNLELWKSATKAQIPALLSTSWVVLTSLNHLICKIRIIIVTTL